MNSPGMKHHSRLNLAEQDLANAATENMESYIGGKSVSENDQNEPEARCQEGTFHVEKVAVERNKGES